MVKTAPNPFLDTWECARKILSSSLQGFGFQLSFIFFSITSLLTLDFVHRYCGYNFLKENNIDVAFSNWLTNKRGLFGHLMVITYLSVCSLTILFDQ